MKTPTIARFYRFLDRLGLFGEFWAEFYRVHYGRRRTLRGLENFLKVPPENYLRCAFIWANSDKGHQFWRNIDDRWQRLLSGK